ncbi:MAG: polymer-forming cytoskeletal protein [Oscillospiraceae bacterium]|nr:polymer-forming cytoskeletal protein [Oscillospiraceae bacterium]
MWGKKDTEDNTKKPKTEQPQIIAETAKEIRPPQKETREATNLKTVNTVLGKGMRMDATMLAGEGVVQIEGEFHGEVDINGELVLEKSGYVNGNIKTNIASISGNVTGNIKCSELLHITQTGKIKGDIECTTILMDKGAVFIGYSKMADTEPEPPKSKAAAKSVSELESFIMDEEKEEKEEKENSEKKEQAGN